MTYPETLEYLESFVNYERFLAWPYKESLKLERINNFLKLIGNPHDDLRCIHIAGSKGKGSTCAFIAYILREAGFKVGLYTSPHLSDFRERIRILGHKGIKAGGHKSKDFEGMISRRDLMKIIIRLKARIDKYSRNSKYGPLTFFEIYTAIAFVYFLEKKVDFAVLETGLGGRLDATNVVKPLACAITPISYEHTQKLGNTLREIAGEKAGIIKQKTAVISAPQAKEAMRVIEQRCKEKKARLRVARYITKEYGRLKLGLLGRHQQVNAAVAIAAVEELRNSGVRVGVDAIKDGLSKAVWPGRCEVIARNPCVVLDGAQNVASARVLKKAIRENFSASGVKYRKLILVLGISDDKDIRGICFELKDLADKVILTKAASPRATEPAVLAGNFPCKVAYLTKNVSEARKLAVKLAHKRDLILVTGSLFVVGEFR